ncbi:MAG: HipA domain-containing protein [Mediterranea sp.]|nr:HipA domain-containing protein [Mediterranea sp.]
MKRCLYCYHPIETEDADFHPSCARKMFGTPQAPLLAYRQDEIAELAKQVLRSQTVLTGVQAKLSLDVQKGEADNQQRFTIVGLWGRYILKPQTSLYPHLPELEDLTMHLATAAKMDVVPHSLIRFEGGELSYLTRRIDRTSRGKKIAMEDMCQLTERLTEYKYRGSYEQIAKAIQRYSSTPMIDLIRFWEQVIFSWITGNADMHLKNFSLIKSATGYRLAPAYDLLSTALVMPEDTEELALTLNGKKRKLKRADFEKAMLASELQPKVIENLFGRFIKAQPVWAEIIGRSFVPQEMQEAYLELIEGRLETLKV